MVYLELDPGTRYPDHTHGGAEDLFLVTGDLFTAGRLMKAGDFVHCEAGTEHQEVISPGGKIKAAGTQVARSLGFLE
jgi:anti-sigma factor ChrR (cupin superfamily)